MEGPSQSCHAREVCDWSLSQPPLHDPMLDGFANDYSVMWIGFHPNSMDGVGTVLQGPAVACGSSQSISILRRSEKKATELTTK